MSKSARTSTREAASVSWSRHRAGRRHVVTGKYREVVEGRRIVQTWVAEFDGAAVDSYPTLLTVEVREVGSGSTELTLRQDQLLTFEDREGNREGWRQCFNKLKALLAKPAA